MKRTVEVPKRVWVDLAEGTAWMQLFPHLKRRGKRVVRYVLPPNPDWERLCLSYVRHLNKAEKKLAAAVKKERDRAVRIIGKHSSNRCMCEDSPYECLWRSKEEILVTKRAKRKA